MQSNDEFFVSRCLQGDGAAFACLVSKYEKMVHAYAYHKVGNYQEAEDITQEVFIKAYKKLGQLKFPHKFQSWLYTIVSNECKMWFRKHSKKRCQEVSFQDVSADELNCLATPSSGDEEMMKVTVRKAMETLPADSQLALSLFYMGDFSIKEVASFMGISPTYVKVKLHRARKRLGGKLEKMLGRQLEQKKLRPGFTFTLVDAIRNMPTPSAPKPSSIRSAPLPISIGVALLIGIIGFGISSGIDVSQDMPVIKSVQTPFPVSLASIRDAGEQRIVALQKQQNEEIKSARESSLRYGNEKREKMVEPIRTEKRIVAVRVVDNQQRPIQGAVIRLGSLRPVKPHDIGSYSAQTRTDSLEFMTDAAGIAQVEYPRYVFERVETGEISFSISHPDYADMIDGFYKIDSSEKPIVMSLGAELVTMALLDGVPIRGFLVDVWIASRYTTLTCGGGVIRGIKEGSCTIHFSYTDPTGREYYSAVEKLELTDGMSYQIELPLEPALSLNGILDPSTPRPIKNGQVKVNMINETKEGLEDSSKAARVWRPFVADVNPDGSFLFPQLPRKYGQIIAICDGFVSKIDRSKSRRSFQNQHFNLQSDGQEIVVAMEPTATFSGRVVDVKGQAIKGAKVDFLPNVFWDVGSEIFMDRHYSATTDAKGEFSVTNLPGYGIEAYTVQSTDYELPIQTVKNRPPRRRCEVKLSPGKEIYEVIQVIPKGQTQIEASR